MFTVKAESRISSTHRQTESEVTEHGRAAHARVKNEQCVGVAFKVSRRSSKKFPFPPRTKPETTGQLKSLVFPLISYSLSACPGSSWRSIALFLYVSLT